MSYWGGVISGMCAAMVLFLVLMFVVIELSAILCILWRFRYAQCK
jgi:hypothetical protein